jgi:hypothetical protein
VLGFDDNDVNCKRDNEIIVFLRVGDKFFENNCRVVVKIYCGDVEEICEVVELDVFDGGGRRGISKVSTTSEYPFECTLPPKNILFDADVVAIRERG